MICDCTKKKPCTLSMTANTLDVFIYKLSVFSQGIGRENQALKSEEGT